MKLGTLMALILAIGACSGWMITKARIQRDAVIAIKRAGGTVRYDWESLIDAKIEPPSSPKSGFGSSKMGRLSSWFGPDYFHGVIGVHLNNSPPGLYAMTGRMPDPNIISQVVRLGGLKELMLSSYPIDRPGLKRLRDQNQLQCLNLYETGLTGADLVALEGMNSLRELVDTLLQVGDQDFPHISSLRALARLEIDGSLLTDKGVQSIQNMHNLIIISLPRSKITNKGLYSFGKLANLRSVNLSYSLVSSLGHLRSSESIEELVMVSTPLTDAGLEPIGGFRGLRRLNLNGTMVTDAGLMHIGRCSLLEQLDVRGTKITPSGLESLRRMFPASSLVIKHD